MKNLIAFFKLQVFKPSKIFFRFLISKIKETFNFIKNEFIPNVVKPIIKNLIAFKNSTFEFFVSVKNSLVSLYFQVYQFITNFVKKFTTKKEVKKK
ncbi:hypothetical protein M0811_05349 [Anaeramoeba ignava]|uniref:Uncharacterized protein n=1 Tax=Anaeramoeba ignava TaxID=1746090 RepID=A0A9Q0LSV1_ANAIG|nr:hypothetical protein M0811_05349 [Anaeramoeba ignava]